MIIARLIGTETILQSDSSSCVMDLTDIDVGVSQSYEDRGGAMFDQIVRGTCWERMSSHFPGHPDAGPDIDRLLRSAPRAGHRVATAVY